MAAGRRIGAMACVLAALAGCTVGHSERPAVLMQDEPAPPQESRKAEPAPLPPLGEPGKETIGWSACAKPLTRRIDTDLGKAAGGLTLSCATITGTHDAQNLPDHGIVNLPLLKATKGGGPKVPLVVVDDIDGKPGTVYAAELAARLPARVVERVAVIGFDRRGTGGSNPIDCIPKGIRVDLLSQDPAAQDVEPLLKAIRKAGQECSIALENEQLAYDSERTAADVEEIRANLGVPRLHAIGRGDGSRVLTTYAAGHPDRVGRVVLDGVPDPSTQTDVVLADVAASAEATLDAFADDCTSQPKCPLGKDPRGAVRTLLERLRTGPAVTADDLRVGPSLALYAVWIGLREPQRWPELATAVDEALGGKPDRLAAFTAPLIDYPAGGPPAIDATMATTCNDTKTRLSQDRIAEIARGWRDKHPLFGGLIAQRLLWCSQWPVRTAPLPGLQIPGLPPTVLVSTEADPQTPAKGTTRAADRLDGSRRIAWQGAGHGAVGRSECVDEVVARFVIDGRVPRNGVNCPA